MVLTEGIETEIAVGWVMLTGTVTEHPFASETVQVYEPAHKVVGLLPVVPEDQLKLNEPVPPFAVIRADPSQDELQVVGVTFEEFATIKLGWLTITDAEFTQPAASFTFTV